MGHYSAVFITQLEICLDAILCRQLGLELNIYVYVCFCICIYMCIYMCVCVLALSHRVSVGT
jgi:hypothetical protein